MSSLAPDYSSDVPLENFESDCDGETFHEDSRAKGRESSPISVDHERTPPPSGVILRYKGYLDFDHEVCQSDLKALQDNEELNDPIVDVLLAMAHAQLTEDQPGTTEDVLVLPTSFGEALLGALGQKTSVTQITRASQRIARYHERFWRSRLILVPLQYRRHWILAAITNSHLAQDSNMVKPPSQVTRRKDDRPDTNPFCILVFNSLRKAWVVTPIIDLLKEFLRYIWSAIRGGVLEYFDSHNVKKR
ncbi:hypothetical protein FRC00_001368 [Tulasnella sp. 408]|nr:hypothetical protein FRC00_001368 [Tulasnella sp. 408]